MTLKEIRKIKGLSQSEAASFLAIPLRSYKRYETDEHYKDTLIYNTLVSKLELFENKLTNKIRCNIKNIVIVGAGYVGFATGSIYFRKFNITYIDKDRNKVKELISQGFNAFTSINKLSKIDAAIICLPTDFNEKTKTFKTDDIKTAISQILKINSNAIIMIKSTVTIGFTEYISNFFNHNVVFVPEFLREKSSIEDAKNPVRFVVGTSKVDKNLRDFCNQISQCFNNKIKPVFMPSKEAEAVKLFSNAYLATRIAFFNELDSFAMKENLDTREIVKVMGLDNRIGDFYNNPGFCYSGYCLPKDVKVIANQTKSTMLQAIDKSNNLRKKEIVRDICKKARELSKDPVVGFYKLDTKKHSNSYRLSSQLEILKLLKKSKIKTLVFDNQYDLSCNDLDLFKKISTLIVTNSHDKCLDDVKEKIYRRSFKL